jgi:DNA-binding MarR family transcriptional regulator
MDNEKQTMYLVVMVHMSDKDMFNKFNNLEKMTDKDWEDWANAQTIDPVALYSNPADALEWAAELEEEIRGTADEENTYFDVMVMDVDERPALLDQLREERELMRDTIEKILIKLMKDGLVDQLIGEDGRFYYEITDSGRKKLEETPLPQEVKDFLKKKMEEKDENGLDFDEF